MAARTHIVPLEHFEGLIHLVRGQKVMLDRDLAMLYGVETRVLNQAVRRNLERFPENFMFALTREEILRISQFVTSSDIKFSKNVLAFTEQGVESMSAVVAGHSDHGRVRLRRTHFPPKTRVPIAARTVAPVKMRTATLTEAHQQKK